MKVPGGGGGAVDGGGGTSISPSSGTDITDPLDTLSSPTREKKKRIFKKKSLLLNPIKSKRL